MFVFVSLDIVFSERRKYFQILVSRNG